ncbi:MAG TPA: hypothetical protein VLE54_05055, partial [Thermoanaerobaculia bacterium]|nr:hypothetical protein [Thermoanaerobaculia bacterium]
MTDQAAACNRGGVVRRVVVACSFLLLSARLAAQATGTTTGDVRGRVEDESGAAVAKVRVTATSTD